jgi:Tfp pilus assembly protein PilF
VHNNFGLALLRLGRPAEARAQFEDALRWQPDYAEARANLGRLPIGPPAVAPGS